MYTMEKTVVLPPLSDPRQVCTGPKFTHRNWNIHYYSDCQTNNSGDVVVKLCLRSKVQGFEPVLHHYDIREMFLGIGYLLFASHDKILLYIYVTLNFIEMLLIVSKFVI